MFYDLFFDGDFGFFDGLVGVDKRYKVLKEDGKTVLVFNAVGVDKKDIVVETVSEGGNNFLHIHGETKTDLLGTYKFDQRFKINQKEVDSISARVENGLLYVTLDFKKPIKKNIKVEWK